MCTIFVEHQSFVASAVVVVNIISRLRMHDAKWVEDRARRVGDFNAAANVLLHVSHASQSCAWSVPKRLVVSVKYDSGYRKYLVCGFLLVKVTGCAGVIYTRYWDFAYSRLRRTIMCECLKINSKIYGLLLSYVRFPVPQVGTLTTRMNTL